MREKKGRASLKNSMNGHFSAGGIGHAKCIPTFFTVSGCIQKNYIYTGYNLDQGMKITTLSGCMKECQVAKKCQFWSYISGTCYLKSDRSAGNFSENSVSGAKKCLGMKTKILTLCHHLH